MTTIESNQQGKQTISYHITGSEADYTAQLKAVAAAVSSNGIGDENRQTLGGMLIQMLPNEDQVNFTKKQ